MRIAKTLSITLPPELLVKAQQTAEREHRTMSELVREALRRYISGESRSKVEVVKGLRERFSDTAAELGISSDHATSRESWRELMEYGQAKAREMGITSEEDVDRVVHEYRQEKRAKRA